MDVALEKRRNAMKVVNEIAVCEVNGVPVKDATKLLVESVWSDPRHVRLRVGDTVYEVSAEELNHAVANATNVPR